jgi:hypothetical protein
MSGSDSGVGKKYFQANQVPRPMLTSNVNMLRMSKRLRAPPLLFCGLDLCEELDMADLHAQQRKIRNTDRRNSRVRPYDESGAVRENAVR